MKDREIAHLKQPQDFNSYSKSTVERIAMCVLFVLFFLNGAQYQDLIQHDR